MFFFSLLAAAEIPAAWVGSWYSETKEDKQYAGKNYDIRRELLVNRADGTKTNTFRYYAGTQMIAESTATYAWGVDNGVYWTVCRTVIRNNQAAACSTRAEYEVLSSTAREMRYRSRASGTTYSILRVNDNFKLP
jgi:hypothetical protein